MLKCPRANQIWSYSLAFEHGSPYRSGRSTHWMKIKNPAAPAVTREAEEEWR